MQILSIGNSFSQDAQRYLHQIARADGICLSAYNLYIGGCPLSLHYRNMMQDARAYALEMNGEGTGFFVSLKEALLNRDWDVVTVQQVSNLAPDYQTYQPYLSELVAFVRACVPKAKIAVHETWAYEKDSYRLCTELGYKEPSEMYRDIKAAYQEAYRDIKADLLIPSGELMHKLSLVSSEQVHRDTFHASLGLGRYAIGLLWFSLLTERNINTNSFRSFDSPVSEADIEKAKACVTEVMRKK